MDSMLTDVMTRIYGVDEDEVPEVKTPIAEAQAGSHMYNIPVAQQMSVKAEDYSQGGLIDDPSKDMPKESKDISLEPLPVDDKQISLEPLPVSEQTKKAITIMSKGWLDQTPDEAPRAPVSSRQWGNRVAKKVADQYFDISKGSAISVDNIWGAVLRAEGGYSNDPRDRGGETKYGISKRAYPELDIKGLTPEQAKGIFKQDYFDKIGGEVLLKINPGLATHVADMAFNAGPKTAIKLLYDAAGLPRETQVTPELLDRLSNSEDLVKDYSIARLKYYSSLQDSPTFIKGWTNRVNNLNKALGISSGLQGAYKAARNLDVDTLVKTSYGGIRNAVPVFKDLSPDELDYLRNGNLMLSPGYVPKKKGAVIKDASSKELSSIGEVFSASWANKFYLNTGKGLEALANQEAYKASEENRKALGDKFDKSWLERLSFGMYGGVTSLKDWEKEVKAFKQEFPDIKLPYETTASVYERVQVRAKQIESEYNKLNSGSFTGGISDAAKKLTHVVAGYLPAEIMGSAGDTIEGGSMFIPGAGAVGQGVKGLAKAATIAMGGVGASQLEVQPGRQAIGLEGGLQQGIENTLAAGAGTVALGGLGNLIGKLWKSNSKVAAETTTKIADTLEEALKKEIPDETRQQLIREVDSLRSQANVYKDNPHGSDYVAKMKLERNLSDAMEDISNNKPVRLMEDSAPSKYVPTTKEYIKDMNSAFDDEMDTEGKKLFNDTIKFWNDFKRQSIANNVVESADDLPFSTVPVTTKVAGTNQVLEFPTREEAAKFMLSPEGKQIAELSDSSIVKGPNGFYFAKSADLEPAENVSGRMLGEDTVDFTMGDVNAKGFVDSPDAQTAQMYPQYSRIKELGDLQKNEPRYPEYAKDIEVADYLREYAETAKVKLNNIDKSYDTALQRMSELKTKLSNTQLDGDVPRISLGEGLDTTVDDAVSIDQVLKDFDDERSAISQIFSCMVGGK